ncbi:MAG: hypothetical protein PSN44_00855 [Gammaproteobacteria bacterium]|nr:hypothetical protein [Gammaproteobacteria bacterium]
MLCVSFWNRNTLIDELPIAAEVFAEPIQSKVHKKPFSTEFHTLNYHIEPIYNYDLYGLVVSFRHHDGNQSLHKLWGDHINVADVCVVWKEFAASPYLNKMDFWNGQFTCMVSAPNNKIWANFNGSQLSNNHLISDNEFIRQSIQDIKVGDQIHIKGWLSNYSNDNGGTRRTSIVRTDSGNGACETIFVNQFEIIKPYDNPWRTTMYLSLLIFILSLINYFRTPYKPYRNRI